MKNTSVRHLSDLNKIFQVFGGINHNRSVPVVKGWLRQPQGAEVTTLNQVIGNKIPQHNEKVNDLFNNGDVSRVYIPDLKERDFDTERLIKTKEVFFGGSSGCYYPFTIYPLDADLPDIGAVYIFIRAAIPGQYKPLYIGETDTFATSSLNYEKWLCIVRNMADCVCIYIEDDAAARLQIARDLIALHHPPCNE